jgi:hypothetical protein
MRISSYILTLLIVLPFGSASAQQLALAPDVPECPFQDPDSVQISWNTPCEQGDWLFDTQSGCRMWDWHRDPQDKAIWSGACPGGQKEGHGLVQWFEHGQRIDRFEGTYHKDRREGVGRYDWNQDNRYEGHYANDLPNGLGTATIAGEVFAGEWRNGCLKKGDHVVAIGVPRTSCSDGASATPEKRQATTF